MVESTARAERFALQNSTSPFYTWEVSQKPVSVRIPFSLIDRLEREAVESFRSLSSKGSEIGGLLIGSVSPGNPLVVSVADYELIECDHARGPLYHLSDADLGRFERAIEQRLAAGGPGVAGFFRSHSRKGIALDADDMAFFSARLRDPHHIALLVRPFATKASTAGIFIWEGGKVHGDASYLEFPFRSSDLGAPKPAAEPADAARAAGPVEAPPLAPKPAGRIQIVPSGARREVSLPTPPNEAAALHLAAPAATAHTTLPEPAPVAAPALAPAKPAVEEKPAKAEKPAKLEKTEEIEKIERPAKSDQPEKAGKTGTVVPAATPDIPATRSGKPLKLILAAAASIALFVVLFVYPGLLHSPIKTAPLGHQDSSLLQLRVERSAGELVLTWNRDADVIKTASKAVLSISDGAQNENVEMDLAQLRNGSIQYSPSSADISFRMEVTGRDQTKTTSESVRVLRTRPSPIQDQTQLPQPTATGGVPVGVAPVTPANAAGALSPTPGLEPAAAEPEAPKAISVPLKAFQTESLSQRLRPAAAGVDLPEEPGVSGAVASAQIPGVTLNAVSPGPRAPAPPVVAAPAANAQNAKSGGQIQQAVLILRKEPEYPKIAKQTGAKGLVTVTATIGKDGRIKTAKVISGHPMLANAAREAVLQWIYKPTLLNGLAVETETTIQLNFLGEK
jgi:periplasmic protein TonB